MGYFENLKSIREEIKEANGFATKKQRTIDVSFSEGSDVLANVRKLDGVYDTIACFMYHSVDYNLILNILERLKDNIRDGKILIEVGNYNSLNEIRVRQTNQGQPLVKHAALEDILVDIEALGYKVVEHRSFQLFPLYGHQLDFLYRSIFEKYHIIDDSGDCKMFDEIVSSSPMLRGFAFRHFLTISNVAIDVDNSEQKIFPKNWITGGRGEKREQAYHAVMSENINEALIIYEDLLREDPTDIITVLQMMDHYKDGNEKEFTKRLRTTMAKELKALDGVFDNEVCVEDIKPKDYVTIVKDHDIKSPAISVIIPIYNQAHMIGTTLNSLLYQSFGDFEIIIVDDGCDHENARALEAISDERVKLLRHKSNMKLPTALNTGHAYSLGQYITWVSADNWCSPIMLEALFGALELNKKVGMAYGDFFLVDANGTICSKVSNPDYALRNLLVRNKGNAAFLYRRKVMEMIGDYDVNLEGAEDWDYWLRIAKISPFAYVPEPLYYYRLHADSMQSKDAEKVNDSAIRLMQKLFKDNSGVDMSKLYPSAPRCQNIPRAMAVACKDFALLLEGARVNVPGLADKFLARAKQYTEYDSIPENYRETEELFKNMREDQIIHVFDQVA